MCRHMFSTKIEAACYIEAQGQCPEKGGIISSQGIRENCREGVFELDLEGSAGR